MYQPDPFLTFSTGRNIWWKGHADAKGIRAVFRHKPRNLRIFERVGEPGDMHIEYSEIMPEYWHDRFGN